MDDRDLRKDASFLGNVICVSGEQLRAIAKRAGFIPTTWIMCFLIANFLLCYWVPPNDYDSLANHIARIVIERFGPLNETATAQWQLIFPRFYDYLHAPLISLGYFLSFPTFGLFIAFLLAIVRIASTRTACTALLLIFSTQAVLVSISAWKNDLGLGLIAFFCWLAIYHLRSPHVYAPVVILLLCALPGTKWHGFILAGALGILFLFELWRHRRFSPLAAVFIIILLPAYMVAASVGVYLENWLQRGSLFPISADLAPLRNEGFWTFIVNIWRLAAFSIIDVFELPLATINAFSENRIWKFIDHIFPGAKQYGLVVQPSSIVSVYGYVLLLLIVANIRALFTASIEPKFRAAAAVALLYGCAILYTVSYNNVLSRYLLPMLVLGILPAAEVVAQIKVPRALVGAAVAYMIYAGALSLFLHHERPLVNVPIRAPDGSSRYVVQSIWPKILDRDRLYFGMWRGYEEPFVIFRKEVHRSDSLLVINGAGQGNAPVMFPFLLERQPANTKIMNAQGSSLPALARTDFVLTFFKEFADPNYELVYQYPTREVQLFRRLQKVP
jgi:hypothetical protein